MWMRTEIIQSLDAAISYMYTYTYRHFLADTSHFKFTCFFTLLTLGGETWNRNIFCWFLLCLFAPKNVYLILLSIFIKISLKDEPCQTVFGASRATFLTWGFFHLKEKRKKKKNNFWEMVHCNLETELCKHWVKSSLFPVTLSLMKVAKSPGGLKSTVCLCLGERSRGTRGEARW